MKAYIVYNALDYDYLEFHSEEKLEWKIKLVGETAHGIAGLMVEFFNKGNKSIGVIMEETKKGKPLEIIAGAAIQLRSIQEQITDHNASLENLKKEQAKLSEEIVVELELIGGDVVTDGVSIRDVGLVKINNNPHPKPVILQGFLDWCKENDQHAPALSINPRVLQSWYKDQASDSLPLPSEEVLGVYWKKSVRVNKGK